MVGNLLKLHDGVRVQTPHRPPCLLKVGPGTPRSFVASLREHRDLAAQHTIQTAKQRVRFLLCSVLKDPVG